MASWFYVRNNQQVGPVTLEQLQAMLQRGELRQENRVWCEGMPDWAFINTIPNLQSATAAQSFSAPNMTNSGTTLSYQSALQYPSPKARAKWTIVLFYIVIVGQILLIPATLMTAWIVPPTPGAPISRPEAIQLMIMGLFMCGAGLMYLGALLGCAIAFPMWMHRANRAARALGTSNMDFTPGWAAGWFFIPFANLVMTYRVAVELWKTSNPDIQLGSNWRASAVSSVVGLWWGFWIIGNIIGWMGSVVQKLPGSTPMPGLVLTCISIAMGIVAAIMAIQLIKGITNRLEQRAMSVARPG